MDHQEEGEEGDGGCDEDGGRPNVGLGSNREGGDSGTVGFDEENEVAGQWCCGVGCGEGRLDFLGEGFCVEERRDDARLCVYEEAMG